MVEKDALLQRFWPQRYKVLREGDSRMPVVDRHKIVLISSVDLWKTSSMPSSKFVLKIRRRLDLSERETETFDYVTIDFGSGSILRVFHRLLFTENQIRLQIDFGSGSTLLNRKSYNE